MANGLLVMIEGGRAHYIGYGDTNLLAKNKILLESSSTKKFVLEEVTREDDVMALRSDTDLLTTRFSKYINTR